MTGPKVKSPNGCGTVRAREQRKHKQSKSTPSADPVQPGHKLAAQADPSPAFFMLGQRILLAKSHRLPQLAGRFGYVITSAFPDGTYGVKLDGINPEDFGCSGFPAYTSQMVPADHPSHVDAWAAQFVRQLTGAAQ